MMDSCPLTSISLIFTDEMLLITAPACIKLIRNSTNECTNTIRVHFMRMSTTTLIHTQFRWWMILNHNRTKNHGTYFTPNIWYMCVRVYVRAKRIYYPSFSICIICVSSSLNVYMSMKMSCVFAASQQWWIW